MKSKNVKYPDFSGWCFAVLNSKLAEIYFDKKKNVWGHCFVKRSEYTKREQKMIDADIKKVRFVYKNRKYNKI